MPPSKPLRLGILVPSSNTALEPLTYTILQPIYPHVTVHFTRLPVTSISLEPTALNQFALAPMLAAAKLLADAGVDVIGWSGTSAGWCGFERDEELCRSIERETGVKATTSTLALNKALRELKCERLGLCTPYTGDVQEAIVRNYGGIGVEVVEERHLDLTGNREIVNVGMETLDRMVEEVVKGGKVQAVTTFCTNLRAAERVQVWEERFGVPVFDTVATVLWDMLRIGGVDMHEVKGSGKLFEMK